MSVEVDGYELPPMPWGLIEIPAVPGPHTFRVFRRAEGRILSFTELVAQTRPGEVLNLLYSFFANDSNLSDGNRPGGRKAMLVDMSGTEDGRGAATAMLLIFGFIAVVFALLVGAALLLRLA